MRKKNICIYSHNFIKFIQRSEMLIDLCRTGWSGRRKAVHLCSCMWQLEDQRQSHANGFLPDIDLSIPNLWAFHHIILNKIDAKFYLSHMNGLLPDIYLLMPSLGAFSHQIFSTRDAILYLQSVFILLFRDSVPY